MQKSRWCCALVLCSTYALSQNQAPLNWQQVRDAIRAGQPDLAGGQT